MSMYTSAGIVIRMGKKLLVCNPKGRKDMDMLGPPKGHVEKDESLIDAAIRETKEEIGIKVRKSKISNKKDPILVEYRNKSNKIYKKVYLYLVDINKLSDIKLEDEVVPKDQLQKEEISWAGFLTKKELKGKIFHRFSTLLDLI